jgi:hypothetical protein
MTSNEPLAAPKGSPAKLAQWGLSKDEQEKVQEVFKQHGEGPRHLAISTKVESKLV